LFEIEIPKKGALLTKKEYESLVNKIKSNFLGYVSILDTDLTMIISELFLRDKKDFSLWSKTVFDEERAASFGAKTYWLGKILAHHKVFAEEYKPTHRRRIIRSLDQVRKIRNDFAHTFTLANASDEIIKNRKIILFDFEEGVTTTKTYNIETIANMIQDSFLHDELNKIERIAVKIRHEKKTSSLRKIQERISWHP
jgi:hypothetical protein